MSTQRVGGHPLRKHDVLTAPLEHLFGAGENPPQRHCQTGVVDIADTVSGDAVRVSLEDTGWEPRLGVGLVNSAHHYQIEPPGVLTGDQVQVTVRSWRAVSAVTVERVGYSGRLCFGHGRDRES